MKKVSNYFHSRWVLPIWLCLLLGDDSVGQVPGLLNYQGRVFVGSTAFEGNGQFKFALVNQDGSQSYWMNSVDGNSNGQPDHSVTIGVNAGLYSVVLGDAAIPNMDGISPSIFSNSDVYLRVWFDDGISGFQQLLPDRRLVAVGYALMAADVADGTITSEKLSTSLAEEITTLTAQIESLTERLDDLPDSGLTIASISADDADLQEKGFQLFSTSVASAWMNGAAADEPSARFGHTAVWTGEEMIVWGGNLVSGVFSSSGAIYSPETDRWNTLSPVNAPEARSGHTAVWTGQEMIVWGGFTSGGYAGSGARLVPSTKQWTALNTTTMPAGRSGHVAVWTGSKMLVWGGANATGLLNDGAVYDPGTEQWVELSFPNAPEARTGAVAVWTGDRVLIWGGEGVGGGLNSGSQLLFDGNGNPTGWSAMSAVGAPPGRITHVGVWTGQGLIVWGGDTGGAVLGDGALYDPANDSWTSLTSSGAPIARSAHSAVWTGKEMVVFGGLTSSGEVSNGGVYDPLSGKWRALSTQGGPLSRSGATMVWSGSDLLVFGGQSGSQSIGSLQRLNPEPTWYFYRKQ